MNLRNLRNRRNLRLSRAGQFVAIALLALFLGSGGGAAHAETIERDGLVIVFDEIDRGYADLCARLVRTAAADVKDALGVGPVAPLEVRLAKNRAALERAVAELAGGAQPPPWALAVAVPAANAIAVRTDRLEVATANDLGSTLRHEVAHLALGRAAPGLPRWLDEGLSMWAAGDRLGEAERAALARLAKNDAVPRLAEIARDFPAHADRANVAYALSLAFVEWVARGWGEVPLRRFVRAAGDVGAEAAFEEAFGLPLAAAEERFRADLAERASILRELVYGASAITVAALIAIVAFFRYRVRRRRALARLAHEEEPPAAPPADG